MSEEVANEIANAASSQSGNTSPFFSESANAIISALNGETVTESTRYSPEVNRIIKAINEGGGGGSGDFTTAKVTLTKTAHYVGAMGTYKIFFPFVWEDEYTNGLVVDQDGNIFYYDESWTDTAEIYVPLFKGIAYINVFVSSGFNPSYISCSGDAQYDAEGPIIVITGDCTITLSGEEK